MGEVSLASRAKPGSKVEFTGESEGRFVKTIYVVCNIWKKVYPLLIIGDVVKE